jgi:carboxypeptidase A1
VDLNRNCDAQFGDNEGSSPYPCSEIYRGPAPFSEPETQALKNVVMSLKNPIAYFSIHSYSQLWMYPYGFTDGPAPDRKELDKLARIATKALNKVHGKIYDPGQITATIGKLIHSH